MPIEFGGTLYWLLNKRAEPGDELVFQAVRTILFGDMKDYVPTVLYAVILRRTYDNMLITALYNDERAITTSPTTTYWIGSPKVPLIIMGFGYALNEDVDVLLRKGVRADLSGVFLLTMDTERCLIQ